MGKSERSRRQNARERIAAQRAAARRAQTRQRVLLAGGSVAVVIAAVVAIIVVRLSQRPPAPGGTITSAAYTTQLTTVPASVFDAVGPGTATGLSAITGRSPLRRSGKPEVLFIGGEYCPFCAAERWAIAAALSRFGRLSELHFIHSSPTDVYPNTPTLSFYKSSYTSTYVSFVPVEWYGEADDPSTPFVHVYLQRPTKPEAALFSEYGNGFPFLDIANSYRLPATSYPPSDLDGLTWAQVLAALRDPAGKVGRDIDGAANIIAAGICRATGSQPASVCQSAGVTAAARRL